LCRSIRLRGKLDPVFVKDIEDVHGLLMGMVRPGDIVLTQGAGSVGSLAKELAEKGFQ
jgi:UDP-N-acetylmuramate--alanine ligase